MTLTGRLSYAAAAASSSLAGAFKSNQVDSVPSSGELPRKSNATPVNSSRSRISSAAAADESDCEDHRSWCSTPTNSLTASDADVDTSCSSSSGSESEQEEEKSASPAYSVAYSVASSASSSSLSLVSLDTLLPVFPSPAECEQMDDEEFCLPEEEEMMCEEECYDEEAAVYDAAAAEAAAQLAQDRFDAAVELYTAHLDGARCFRAGKQSRYHYESERQVSQMRRVLTQPRKLSEACAKASPIVPRATPHSNNRARNERLQIQPMRIDDKSLYGEKPTVRKEPTTATKNLPKAEQMSSAQRRTLQMRIRNVPQCLRTCTSTRWAKVLQHRMMTRQIVKERNAWRRTVKRTRADKLATARKIKSARFHSELHMHRKDRLQLLPAGCNINLAQAVHWRFTYTDALRREQHKNSQCTNPVLPPTPAPAPTPLSPFDRFRLSWYARHRAQIENAVPESIHSGMHVSTIRCADIHPRVSSAFMRLRANLAQRDPILAFHGTSQANHASILQHGLLIPGRQYVNGTRIGVANGSAYGKGIYSSTDLMMSLGYTRCVGPIQRLFVCATLTDMHRHTHAVATGEVKHHGAMLVFFREQRIVPVFTIDVATGPRKEPIREEGPLGGQRSIRDGLDAEEMAALKLLRPDALAAKSNLRQELRKYYTRAARITRAWKGAFRKMLQAPEEQLVIVR